MFFRMLASASANVHRLRHGMLNSAFNFPNYYRNPTMKSVLQAVLLTSLFASFSAFAHHPAADIVAEDIYIMIDANVADTPHALLDFTSMGR